MLPFGEELRDDNELFRFDFSTKLTPLPIPDSIEFDLIMCLRWVRSF